MKDKDLQAQIKLLVDFAPVFSIIPSTNDSVDPENGISMVIKSEEEAKDFIYELERFTASLDSENK